MLGAQFFGCRLGARLPEDADDLFLAESLSFHEVCGVDITTQTPVQACLLFGEQVKLTPANWANDFKTCKRSPWHL